MGSRRAFEAAPGRPRPAGGDGDREVVVMAPRSARSRVSAFVRLARPKQWTKNALVVAAPATAGVLDEPAAIADTAIAFVCFCLAASGTYFVNDALDAEADRSHPTKRTRPIASGAVTVLVAGSVTVGAVAGLISRSGPSSFQRPSPSRRWKPSAPVWAPSGTVT